MGFELALEYVPNAAMSADRIRALHDCVEQMTVEELDNDAFGSEDHTRDELVTILHEQIDLIVSAEDHWRDINHVSLPELPYEVLVTGGISFGESPSDLFDAFSIVKDCGPLFSLLLKWAKEDFQSRLNLSNAAMPRENQ